MLATFTPIILSPEEKEEFAEYLRGRGYAPSTIETVFNYLLLTTANTKHTRHKANWARRLYHEWERARHKQTWLRGDFMRSDDEGRND